MPKIRYWYKPYIAGKNFDTDERASDGEDILHTTPADAKRLSYDNRKVRNVPVGRLISLPIGTKAPNGWMPVPAQKVKNTFGRENMRDYIDKDAEMQGRLVLNPVYVKKPEVMRKLEAMQKAESGEASIGDTDGAPGLGKNEEIIDSPGGKFYRVKVAGLTTEINKEQAVAELEEVSEILGRYEGYDRKKKSKAYEGPFGGFNPKIADTEQTIGNHERRKARLERIIELLGGEHSREASTFGEASNTDEAMQSQSGSRKGGGRFFASPKKEGTTEQELAKAERKLKRAEKALKQWGEDVDESKLMPYQVKLYRAARSNFRFIENNIYHMKEKIEKRNASLEASKEDGMQGKVTVGHSEAGILYNYLEGNFPWSGSDAEKEQHERLQKKVGRVKGGKTTTLTPEETRYIEKNLLEYETDDDTERDVKIALGYEDDDDGEYSRSDEAASEWSSDAAKRAYGEYSKRVEQKRGEPLSASEQEELSSAYKKGATDEERSRIAKKYVAFESPEDYLSGRTVGNIMLAKKAKAAAGRKPNAGLRKSGMGSLPGVVVRRR